MAGARPRTGRRPRPEPGARTGPDPGPEVGASGIRPGSHGGDDGDRDGGEDEIDETLAAVGPRLRTLRQRRGVTLADLAETTGISVSTLSRLESGQRRATLQLLLTLARAHRVPLDDLVGAPATGDPRVHLKPVTRHGMTYVPLTDLPGPLQAFKFVIPPSRGAVEPRPNSHEGFEWLYVLSGRLRLVLGEHDIVMGSGEAAEFDTRVPHWFASADDRPVECLCLFGKQGERVHLTAKPRSQSGGS